MLHILDVAELLRVVQAAVIISSKNNVSLMAAFDYYLMERFKRAFAMDRIYFEMIAKFA